MVKKKRIYEFNEILPLFLAKRRIRQLLWGDGEYIVINDAGTIIDEDDAAYVLDEIDFHRKWELLPEGLDSVKKAIEDRIAALIVSGDKGQKGMIKGLKCALAIVEAEQNLEDEEDEEDEEEDEDDDEE